MKLAALAIALLVNISFLALLPLIQCFFHMFLVQQRPPKSFSVFFSAVHSDDQNHQCDRRHAEWLKKFNQLKGFVEHHGHCRIPSGKLYNSSFSLSSWVSAQRRRKKEGTLSSDKIQLLQSIPSFHWEPLENAWMEYYKSYVNYLRIIKNCSSSTVTTTTNHDEIPRNYAQNPLLAVWLYKQRQLMDRGILSNQRVQLLKQLNTSLFNDHVLSPWEKQYHLLQEFQRDYGHCSVPQRHSKKQSKYRNLGGWVNKQRFYNEKGLLSKERKNLLDKLGFEWTVSWMQMYQNLLEYKNIYGHCSVPVDYSHYNNLGRWVHNQRHSTKLSPQRRKLLNKIGMDWNPNNTTWMNYYRQLCEQYPQQEDSSAAQFASNSEERRNNTIRSPSSLRLWITTQRQLKRKGLLHPDREALLNQIGFTFQGKKTWMDQYTALKQLILDNLTTSAIQGRITIERNIPLQRWFHRQRALSRKGFLSKQQQNLLKALPNFRWSSSSPSMPVKTTTHVHNPADTNEEERHVTSDDAYIFIFNNNTSLQQKKRKQKQSLSWMESYQALQKFQQSHRHCRVPTKTPLGKWMQELRDSKDLLAEDQLNMLNELGFQWSVDA